MAEIVMELNGTHIGSVIQFPWVFPIGKTTAKIRGQLRQVSHAGLETVVAVISPDTVDTGSGMDEFVLHGGTPVTVFGENA